MNIKRPAAAVLIISLLFSLCACGGQPEPEQKFDKDAKISVVESGLLTENDSLSLSWDEDQKCVLLCEKSTGKIWSTIPYDYYLEKGENINTTSPLNINVADATTLKQELVRGSTSAVNEGRISSEKLQNGIKVTYYFDTYEISIPICYELRADSLSVTLPSEEIREGGKSLLISVSVAPFLCAASGKSDDAYLFVPSGSGALMYARETADTARKFSGDVYGTDRARMIPEQPVNNESVRLPVFGAKDGENALLGIIEQGAESSVVEAEAGNKRTSYADVYATFYIRGYDIFETSLPGWKYDDIPRFSKNRTDADMTVGYYPLSGDHADINGMAKRYRQYLEASDSLTDSETAQSPYSLTLLGGVTTKSLFLGFPYDSVKPMTTFLQGKTLIEKTVSNTGINPQVRLVGFGQSGIDAGKIAGGYGFASVLGSDKQRKSLEDYCLGAGISLYTDFDLIHFNQSGGGFSATTGSAKTASLHAAEVYGQDLALRTVEKEITVKLLKRGSTLKAAQKLIETAQKKNISGISLSSLGSYAYSDYSDAQYAVKGGMASDVQSVIKNIRDAGLPLAVNAANAYAAAAADTVLDSPMNNGGFYGLDEVVPFYAMVFRGLKPLYAPAVNLAANTQYEMIQAVAAGVGINFTLINSYDVSYADNTSAKLYGMVYSSNEKLMSETLLGVKDYYAAVGNAKIERYELTAEKISITVFDNGVTVYANQTGEAVTSPAGNLEPYDFIWTQGVTA